MLTEDEKEEKLFSWRYRTAYVDYPTPEGHEPERQWGVVEYWPELGSYTESFVEPIGDDRESLLKVLQWMIDGINVDEEPVVLNANKPSTSPGETPFDKLIATAELDVAGYEVGKVPEHLLKMELLLSVKRNCYLQGQADGRNRYYELATTGQWALDCIRSGIISTTMVSQLASMVAAAKRDQDARHTS